MKLRKGCEYLKEDYKRKWTHFFMFIAKIETNKTHFCKVKFPIKSYVF